MSIFGNIGEFAEDREDFDNYCDRFEAFATTNGFDDDKRSALFLATVGSETFKLLKDVLSPEHPNTKTYAELKKTLSEHFNPKPIVIAERFKFWSATQGDTESVGNFIVRLKNLASNCKFETFLQQAMRDKLVCGLNKQMSKTQTYLLTQADLTFELARKRCLANEMAAKANVQMAGPGTSTAPAESAEANVHRIQGRKKTTFTKCQCCGKRNHKTENCYLKDAVCHKCNVKGHIKPMCPNVDSTSKSRAHVKDVKSVEVEHDSEDCSSVEVYQFGFNTIHAVSDKNEKM